MAGYTIPGRMEAWTQAIFGAMLAAAIYFTLQSPFLAFLTFVILVYYPDDDEKRGERINSVGFALLMGIILFWGFGKLPGPAIGLGIELGIPIEAPQIAGIILFIVLSVFVGGFASFRNENVENAAMSFGVVLVLFAAGIGMFVLLQPWNWNVSAVIFTAIWLLTFANGLFGGVEAKQAVGIIMIIITFVIYTLGIGSDVVGAAAFGQWWPPVKDFGKQTLGPVKDAFTDMFKSFKEAVKLITCPTCAARDILSGIYANPTGKGKVGSFGVEFEELSVPDGKITLGRPFSVNLGIKNQGAVEAKDVKISLGVAGEKEGVFGLTTKDTLPAGKDTDVLAQEDAKQFLVVGNPTCKNLKDSNIVKEYSSARQLAEAAAEKANIIKEGEAASAGIQDYVFPITARADYKYSIDSQLTMEFISSAERERLLKEKKLERRKEKSTMTTAPLALSLFADIDQPIEEGTRFYLGIEAKAQERDGYADDVVVKINLPPEFVTEKTKIIPLSAARLVKINGKEIIEAEFSSKKGEENTIIWNVGKLVGQGDETKADFNAKKLFLDFTRDVINLNGKPGRTFTITASAKDFKFRKERNATVKFEFGGYCCAGETIRGQCFSGEECNSINDPNDKDLGTCKAKPPVEVSIPTVDRDFCNSNGKKCELGWGACTEDKQCASIYHNANIAQSNNIALRCRPVVDWGFSVCCPGLENEVSASSGAATQNQCKAAYSEWLSQTNQIKQDTRTGLDPDAIQKAMIRSRQPQKL